MEANNIGNVLLQPSKRSITLTNSDEVSDLLLSLWDHELCHTSEFIDYTPEVDRE